VFQELLKLRKKITSTVEVLTHLKEKLQFVQGENGILKGRLREVEDKAGKVRYESLLDTPTDP
jgi:regulator of replication initiation timing